jgi:hypothetical protein
MNIITYPLLTKQEQTTLNDAMHFMKMAELQDGCRILGLPDSGKKTELIEKILVFIHSGKVMSLPTIPALSRAKNYPPQPLRANSLMLYGSYKNDLQTRAFFKTLVGPQFHYTAFGIDWLNERWMEGKPPTYQEFADYWTAESARRKKHPEDPKKEWRYIRFVQEMQLVHPDASRNEIMESWKQIQAQNALRARRVLQMIAERIKK